jgi:hypothetical protein
MNLWENTENYFQMGFLPRPKETEEDFCQRAKHLLARHLRFQESLKDSVQDTPLEKYHLEPALAQLEALWKVRPSWPVVIFSQESMSCFHLGALCAQSYEGEELSFIQLHSRFKKRSSFWGYQRDFVLLHEMIHLLREGLDTGVFEEYIAYDTDPSPLRRFLGPFFSSAWMPAVFMIQIWILLFYAFAFSEVVPFFEHPWSDALNLVLGVILAVSWVPWARFGYWLNQWLRFKRKLKASPWNYVRRLFSLSLHEKDIIMLAKFPLDQWQDYLIKLDKDIYQRRLLSILGIVDVS